MPSIGISLRLSNTLRSSTSSSVYTPYALALDFDNQKYWDGTTQHDTISAMPGYTYTRAGAKSELDTNNSTITFAANIPGITDKGYYARTGVTNYLIGSRTFNGWSQGGVTISGTLQTAPDGTNTTRLVTFGTGTEMYQRYSGATSGKQYTESVWVKRAPTNSATHIRLTSTNGFAWNSENSVKLLLTDEWQRLTKTVTASSIYRDVMLGCRVQDSTFDPDCAGSVIMWNAQGVEGTDPGPTIETVGSAASVGADALAVGLADGNYTAVYTFDDNSTQTIPTTINGGVFNHPVHSTTLSRPTIKLVTLETV